MVRSSPFSPDFPGLPSRAGRPAGGSAGDGATRKSEAGQGDIDYNV